ncbi:hypothetical protein ACWCY6_39275 [Streptomyces sp. 900105755]
MRDRRAFGKAVGAGATGGHASYRDKDTGPFVHRTLKGVGHKVPQGAPAAFARAVPEAERMARA